VPHFDAGICNIPVIINFGQHTLFACHISVKNGYARLFAHWRELTLQGFLRGSAAIGLSSSQPSRETLNLARPWFSQGCHTFSFQVQKSIPGRGDHNASQL
jgi:hypothetical protein